MVEVAYRLGYNSAVPRKNTKTRAGSGKPGCLEDKYYEKDHASFVFHCLWCSCCRCCPDRLRRFCFLCCLYRCRLYCFFHRCCPVRQRCCRWFHLHEERYRCPDRSFAEVEPDVTVSYDPTGSGAGITGAADKTLDIGLSSRALKDDEKADVEGTTIALDGIAIIVNNASKVENLTVDQLKQMFTGEITNWSEVGGDDGEIVLIGREAGSGTRDGFESIVEVKDSCKYAQELTATGAVISAVEANPLAIGYASLSAVGDTVKMVTVGGVECSEETVKDGSYEVQRPFVFVTNKSVTLSEQAQAFFDFATSADAADLIRTAGAVPVNE